MEANKVLQYTPIESIEPTIQRLRKSFRSHVTKTKQWRVSQLLALKKGMKDFESEIIKAVQQDLHMDLLLATNEATGKNYFRNEQKKNSSSQLSN